MKRIAAALVSAFLLLLVTAPAALAENGEGWLGKADDRLITFFCFGVMGFFTLIVILASLIQGKLEKRKERRRIDLERLS